MGNLHKKLLTIFLLCSTWLPVCFSYSLNSNQLTDLEGMDMNTFLGEVTAWGVYTPKRTDSLITFCFNRYILGGYNVLSSWTGYFERQYTGLTYPHNMIRFSFFVILVDSADGGETFRIQFDTLPAILGFDLVTAASTIAYPRKAYCGANTWTDYQGVTAIVEFPHTASTLTVKLDSTLNQDTADESFGFRDITALLYMSDNPATSASFGGISNVTLPSTWYSCPTTRQYMSPPNSGTCLPCESTCAECSGSANTQCSKCDPGRYLSSPTGGTCNVCDLTCATCSQGGPNDCLSCRAGYFLTDSFACVDSCPYPLYQSTNSVTDLCKTSCATGEFLYWDRTCSTICKVALEPLTETTLYNYFKLCEYPCRIEKYLYWNGTCGDSCPYPLVTRTKKAKLFCDFPCSTNYVYWNRDCDTTCAFPLSARSEGSPTRRYCEYYCKDTEFMYWNGTCNTKCDFPFIQRVYKGKQFCDFTCSDITKVVYWDGSCQDDCQLPLTLRPEGGYYLRYSCHWKCNMGEFLYWNGTCSTVCVPPLTYSYKNSRFFCNYPCSSGQYLRWDGVCQSSCPYPLLIRVEAGLYYCDFPCTPSLPYLYWNGTCSANCDSPLAITVQGSANFCNFPCNSATDILYWNGTCKTQCNPPLTLKEEGNPIRKFCDYGCDKEAEYLYWNKSCLGSCDSPLSVEAESGLKFCRYPCSTTGTEYLYWNGSCKTECDFPLIIRVDESSNQYCDFACDSATGDYLFWNGTCSPFCLEPLTKEVQGTGQNQRHFCHFGCASLTDYLYWNGSCQSTCEDPLVSKVERGRLFCDPPCSSVFQFFFPDTQTCKSDCVSPYKIDQSLPFARCIPPTFEKEESWFIRNILTPPEAFGTLTLITIPKTMTFLRFLNKTMPQRLYNFSSSHGRNFFSLKIGWSMQGEFSEIFLQGSLDDVFKRNGLHSSFLVNTWPILTSFEIIILIAIVSIILEYVCKIYKLQTLQSFFTSLRILTKWAALLILLGISFDEIILYSFLQFQTFSETQSSDYTLLSLMASLLFLLAYLALIIGTVWLVKRTRTLVSIFPKISNTSKSTALSKWDGYQVLFRGFKSNYFLNQTFYLWYCLRIAVSTFLALILIESPVMQTVFQLGISVLVFLYILLFKPLESRMNHLQLILVEFETSLMNICLLILISLDESDPTNQNKIVTLGDMIITVCVIYNLSIFIFFILKLMVKVKMILNLVNERKSQKAGVWVQVLSVYLQQSGMGFEESNAQLIENSLEGNLLDQFKKKVKGTSSAATAAAASRATIFPENISEFNASDTANPIGFGSSGFENKESIWNFKDSRREAKFDYDDLSFEQKPSLAFSPKTTLSDRFSQLKQKNQAVLAETELGFGSSWRKKIQDL